MALLQVQDLTKDFAGLRALDHVGFTVESRSIVGLIGPNGAGKTTCFNLIAGVFAPTAGEITFGGRRIVGFAPEAICAAGIARTFQSAAPFHGMTVLENVMVGALRATPQVAAARREAQAILARLGLAEKASLPASRLTLPDRKLLEVARALATRPTLLLLDEAMAGLRLGESERIVTVLRDLNAGGLTILLIEHVMRVVMALARRVIVLHHGEKIAEGTPDEVSRDPQVIRSYLGGRGMR